MSTHGKKSDFSLKADFLPITVLQITQNDTKALDKHLKSITEKAPKYFANAPILIDFSSLDNNDEPDTATMCAVIKKYEMQPIAARGIKSKIDLPIITDRVIKKLEPEKSPERKAAKTIVIEKPVRSGTQIYAKDADLIILSRVNAGAEVIADGHIHIYGPLQGRALAGAKGDVTARIFCKTLEAELIAIAGHYLVNEKISMPKDNASMLQIFLNNDKLEIQSI